MATYPRQDTGRTGGSDRDLNPAVVHDGLVIVAPSDAAAIYAFDAESGRLVWKTDPVAEEVRLAHLLGVAKGRLVATGDRVLLFDVKTGKLTATWPDSGKSEGFGRGLLAGNRIYWPTKDRIEVLDQGSGLRAEPPIKLMEIYHTSGGNLVAGDGYLIVAQADALVVFCQNSRLIDRYREETCQEPRSSLPPFTAWHGPPRRWVGISLPWNPMSRRPGSRGRPRRSTACPWPMPRADHQFRLLLRMAVAERPRKEVHLSHGKTGDRCADRLGPTAIACGPDCFWPRSSSRPASRRPRSRSSASRSSTNDCAALTVSTEDGRRGIRADLLIADRLASIVKTQGRAIYESDDRRARELFDRGRREQDPRCSKR